MSPNVAGVGHRGSVITFTHAGLPDSSARLMAGTISSSL